MALVLNEEQQMLKESAQGFLLSMLLYLNCVRSEMQGVTKVMQIRCGNRWWVWDGQPY